MANNTIGWGQGTTNNDIGWGRGSSNDIGWGSVYDSSYVGDTDIVGGGGDTRFIIRIDTTQAGSAADTFVLPWIGTYDVDWGDGNVDLAVTDSQTHVYASSGIYDVKVTAAIGQIYFANSGDKSKLIDIRNWGNVGWTTMDRAFWGCNNLTNVTASDVPDLSGVTIMFLAFRDCTLLTDLDVSLWNTSNVTNMNSTFRFCSSLTDLDVSLWDIDQVTTFINFATDVNIPTATYDAILIAWEAQTPTSGLSIHFGNSEYTAGGAAEAARTSLQVTYGWTIVDGGPA